MRRWMLILSCLVAFAGGVWAALPNQIDPTSPGDTDLVSAGAGQIRNFKQFVVDVFGITVSTNITSTTAPVIISPAGVVTITQAGFTVSNTPNTATTSLKLEDTTGAAKSLLVSVRTNKADFRESTAALGSLMVLDLANNRVGVGTASPSNPLHVAGVTPSVQIQDTTPAAKSLTVAVGANVADLRESAGGSGSLLALDLTNNRVGIGTAAPTVPLHVAGAGRLTGLLTLTAGLAVSTGPLTANVTANSSATVGAGDIFIITSRNGVITLPSITDNPTRLLFFKRDGGAVTPVITAAGGDTIEGAATKTLSTDKASILIIGFSNVWWIIATTGTVT